MVTGIFELILAYQTVQPFIALQIQLIKDSYTMVSKIREVVKEYKARFKDHRHLVANLDEQFAKLSVLSMAMEQSCTTNSMNDVSRAHMERNLRALQSDLGDMEDKLQTFLDRMTLGNNKLWGIPETKKSKSKSQKFHASFDFIMEGKKELQDALDRSSDWVRSITGELTLMMVIGNNRMLNGMGGGLGVGDVAKEKDRKNYYESFKTLNVENLSVDIPVTRHMKRIMMAREKAKNLDDLSMEELEKKLISEYELDYATDINVLENDTDLEYGRKLEVVKGSAKIFQFSLVDSRLFENDSTYEQSLRETLFISTMLSADDNRRNEDDGPPGSLDHDIGRLPKCVGVVKRNDDYPQRFDLLFELPPNTHHIVRTLRSALADPHTADCPIDDRYRIALHLAQSLFLIHSAGLIHRQVRPECVLLTDCLSDRPEARYPHRLGKPFLFGFGQTRDDNGATKRVTFDTHPRRILAYRPPRHQGYDSTRSDRFRMIDDIYGLGVTLLEIGLWKSFFKIERHTSGFVGSGSESESRDAFTYAEDESVFKFKRLTPMQILEKMIKKAERELPKRTCTAYKDIVVSCLGCFEPESGFGIVDEAASELLRKFENIVLRPLRKLAISSVGSDRL